ncbi:MAG: hypothetical protein V4819_03210 [Verrucomicrobiota bacterium]
MAEPTKSKSGGGCFSKLLLLILLVAAAGLASAIFYAIQPQDLTDLASAKPLPERELKVILKNANERGYPLTLSEAEINQWLARTLVTKQGGFLAGKVTFDRVWVRLEDERAEVIMERRFLGKPFTVSMYLKVEKLEDAKGIVTDFQPNGGPYLKDFPHPPKGGRFGKLVVPMGFLYLVLPSYQKLGALFPEEVELGFTNMARVKIEKGKLVLDPREPLGQEGMPKTF